MVPEPVIHLDEASHVYSVDGVVRPNVTTILHRSGLADFSAIPEEIREYVLARGKATHSACHYMLEGDLDENTLDPEIRPRVQALKKFLFHSGFKPRPGMIERRVYHTAQEFCGTYDVVGELPSLSGPCLCDWKNCDPRMSGTEYQTAAYLLCVPGVYYRAAITLKGDGNYSVRVYPPSTLLHDQAVFIQALQELRRQNRI